MEQCQGKVPTVSTSGNFPSLGLFFSWWSLHCYDEVIELDTCFLTRYSLAWSTINGSVLTIQTSVVAS